MSTTVAAPSIAAEVAIFSRQSQMAQGTVRRNTSDLTHDESVRQPDPGGNCLNWVVGHLVWVYDMVLPALGQQPVLGDRMPAGYHRHSNDRLDCAQSLPFAELLAGFEQAATRFQAGLASATPELLDAPAPVSPSNNPKETVRSLLVSISFHQAYHAGQTGLLRRLAGKEGAIR
ncbi:MAG TPA: DinB family protein [Acidobacteriaceae bacterium]|jgi:hypothetical protein|nr:DinB family protein [Acidobacteriaceae bacterium]